MRKHVWKLILRYRRSVLKKHNTIGHWESLSPDAIEQCNQKRLQRMLDYAYNNVPYYKRKFDSAPKATRMSDLPLLEKEDIKENYEDLKGDGIQDRDWYKNATSGSTGQPTEFVQDAHYASFREGLKIVFDGWGGRQISEPKIKLWGSEEDLSNGNSIKTKLGRWLRNVTWINAYSMRKEDFRTASNKINDVKPNTIHAYVEAVANLANFIEENEVAIYSPNSVMTTAGTLRPEMRNQIERVFDCPVHNRYGSREFGTIASECAWTTGLHYCPMIHHIEIIDPDTMSPVEPGESGEIVVTSLTNFSMPLIRYRIGDIAAFHTGSCECGCNWPMITDVQGRVTDHFVALDGSLVYPGVLRKSLYYCDWINQFQIHQTDNDRVVFRLVSDTETPPQSDLEEISDKTKKVLGEDVTVEFDYPKSIDRADSGKYRYTISDVST
ncbi:CapK related-protein [Natronococcus amylolyticus DSM 10524]|uniref:CapK related-protein n=1 Tax=Natronococcus amylolyticus DSM 10524 TaxID=1227497 RepID=L9X0I2_9EURY|nr:CapK related-protein [Natronococcus amylolyticus DSM 10524]